VILTNAIFVGNQLQNWTVWGYVGEGVRNNSLLAMLPKVIHLHTFHEEVVDHTPEERSKKSVAEKIGLEAEFALGCPGVFALENTCPLFARRGYLLSIEPMDEQGD
jgi:hypothetical protein